MAKIIITSESRFVREVELTKERITIGREPHNDITLDNRAVSSEHATITLMQGDAILEDFRSTNGTLMQGARVSRQKLQDGDKFVIATFVLEFLAGPAQVVPAGFVEVLNGVHTRRKIQLSKPLTTVGRPGSSVLAIIRSGGAHLASRIDGELGPCVNGTMLDDAMLRLSHGDVIDLGGKRMAFMSR